MYIESDGATNSTGSSAVEQRLIHRVLSGESECFADLVGADRRRMRRCAARLTGNTTAAEDVVQDALCKAFAHLHQFHGKASFRTWLFRILVNEAHLWARRRGKEITFGCTHEDLFAEVVDRQVSQSSTLDRLVTNETSHRLNTALTALPPKYQHVLRLRFLEGHSIQETAQRLAVSTSAAKTRQHRACEMLKTQLACAERRDRQLARERRRTP